MRILLKIFSVLILTGAFLAAGEQEFVSGQGGEIIKRVRIARTGTVYAMKSWDVQKDRLKADILSRKNDLNVTNRPEAMVWSEYSRSTAERIRTGNALFRLSLRDREALYFKFSKIEFKQNLDENDFADADFTAIKLRYDRDINRRLSLSASLEPYRGTDMEGIGIETGLSWQSDKGLRFSLAASGWKPWVSNTQAASNDGRLHGVAAAADIPLFKRVNLSLAADAARYYFGSEAEGGHIFVGRDESFSGRLNIMLIDLSERNMGTGFLFTDGVNEEIIASNVIFYGYAGKSKFDTRAREDIIAVTSKSEDYRIGMESQFAFSPRLGVSLSGYLGQDRRRGIAWQHLYGMDSKVLFMAADRVKLWLSSGFDSESGNGLDGGKTMRLSCGLNCNF
ncbi:MAG: hypothetical protein ACYTFY_03240 [Planctomycetota bacterium]|jgi:hypothetical protein